MTGNTDNATATDSFSNMIGSMEKNFTTQVSAFSNAIGGPIRGSWDQIWSLGAL